MSQAWHGLWSEWVRILNQNGISVEQRLGGPASNDQIKHLEEELLISLPSDFRDLYLTANGDSDEGGVFFGLQFLTLKEIASEHTMISELAEGMDDESPEYGALTSNYPSLNHIPFLMDQNGNYLGFDVKPIGNGTMGQIVAFGADLDNARVAFRSIDDFIIWCLSQSNSGNLALIDHRGRVIPKLIRKTNNPIEEIIGFHA